MSEQIQNFSTLNPFDDKVIDEQTSVATGKSGSSKIRKLQPSNPFPPFPPLAIQEHESHGI
jgi:hypothetical protein